MSDERIEEIIIPLDVPLEPVVRIKKGKETDKTTEPEEAKAETKEMTGEDKEKSETVTLKTGKATMTGSIGSVDVCSSVDKLKWEVEKHDVYLDEQSKKLHDVDDRLERAWVEITRHSENLMGLNRGKESLERSNRLNIKMIIDLAVKTRMHDRQVSDIREELKRIDQIEYENKQLRRAIGGCAFVAAGTLFGLIMLTTVVGLKIMGWM